MLKKIIAILLAAAMLFALAACGEDADEPTTPPEEEAPVEEPEDEAEAPETPDEPEEPEEAPVEEPEENEPEEEAPSGQAEPGLNDSLLQRLNAIHDFVMPGTAGSSIKAAQQAAALMDWGISASDSAERIAGIYKSFFSDLDAEAQADFIIQLDSVISMYRILLTDGQEDLLASAGYTGDSYPWGGQPIPAIEAIITAAGLDVIEEEAREPYSELMELYVSALSEKWDISTLTESGLSPLLGYGTTDDRLSEFGYYSTDIDADGSPELLIGCVTPDDFTVGMVYGLYTIVNGAPVQLAVSSERDRYYLASDSTIANEGSSGAAQSIWNYYYLYGGELNLVTGIKYDSTEEGKGPWFIVSGEGEYLPISEAEALNITEGFSMGYMLLPFTPFSEYEG